MKSSLVCLYLALTLFLFGELVTCQVAVNNYVIPVPGDCKKYQVCDFSGCFVFICGIGTEFNPKTKVCDYPLRDRSSCGDRGYLGYLGPITIQDNPGTSYPSTGGTYPGYPSSGGASPGYPSSGGAYPGYPSSGAAYPSSPGGAYPGGQGSPAGYPQGSCAPCTPNTVY